MRQNPGRSPRLASVMLVLTLALVLSACGASSTPTASGNASAPSSTPDVTATVAGTSATTPDPSPTSVTTPPASPSAAGSSTSTSGATTVPASSATPGTGVMPADYLDDRSSATEVVHSFYNAINMQQYARAYSYWEPGSPNVPPFDQFQQGYATTTHVDVTFGTVGSGVAAGNLYFMVPVELNSTTSDKGSQTFVGCYTLHLGQPANQTVPPYHPMAIQKGDIVQADSGANVTDLLAKACPSQPDMGQGGMATGKPESIGSDVYLDDRSDGAEVVRSYYNAINRSEYARAYSYWESNLPASTLAPFDQFQQGYANTKGVKLTIGNVTTDAGAGQRYTSVPVTIVASMNDGSTQTYVGCYVTHLAVPEIQTSPPFQPMSLMRATVNKVANNADTNSMMATVCTP